MDSKIKITTYVDSEKIHEESYLGSFLEQTSSEKISYSDKNNKKIKIFIDKIKESVSIEKDDSKMYLAYTKTSNDYSTQYGQMKLETQLVNISKKTKNNLTLYEIVYNIHFGSNDKQKNKLKILVKNI
ncbi:hypothetical protein ACWOCB_08645 [Gemella haemolysans]|jgi:hypothetical protein|uniref:DUF1934 domain-containing protein n=1 Tax=Gemella haemolysans ATCC 10379 TaxID=546270 RepID=C5NX34_9BACL|nr:hypothetical protein [Gemella haemolysans]EER68240.1 hypothetical protein GEMHA0001_0722 [Gemella haemolysans ATCC 10379]KAA8705944.1 hypothetical protein F4V11_08625 [Gemella haemolysans]UBH82553.1 hypothetical protein LA340_00925 [Gemella haemolysans]VEI39193.1 Uncharacterised protein [Gemella haemolysans]